jgi:ABC-type glycerol-3-phosphate transport system substrate-binding protein
LQTSATCARDWFNKGLVMKDAATTSSTAAELMASGNYFCYIASYSYPEADTAASLEAQCGGFDLGAKTIGTAFLDTSSINALTWMVSSTSEAPEAALKFLNLTFTDPEITNLIIYGLKDRDYVLSADGFMSYPEGQDATTCLTPRSFPAARWATSSSCIRWRAPMWILSHGNWNRTRPRRPPLQWALPLTTAPSRLSTPPSPT